ncbi:Probable siderophore transport system ATP-binding protein YusV [Dermatophilus congolensis]|uniref:Probable siderophore transport system ATP-binding protein YusV n=1 Tax=Dermatophilus congolensis TaxID=1863 RepID=A0AA46H1L5_9MICO|nr:ABC transporter ATP-binding protein [Dermatophilus congolensis]STD15719.1 Probable siderophore transport system ATP-binding protein YusV [Dermatophilus congolensis]
MNITTRNLSWNTHGRDIVAHLDLTIPAATTTAIVGPNGCGKTTTLHLLAGIRRPTTGSIHFNDDDVTHMPPRHRARLCALLEQHPHTPLDLTARHIVELGRTPHRGRWHNPHDTDAVTTAMHTAGITHLADRTWPTLSGGERQRVQLARALAQEPRILLLDEPTNHLDLRHQISLLHTVCALNLTVVAVLHDLDLAAAFCEHIIVMNHGRIIATGPTRTTLTTELIADVFGINTRIHHDERTHITWTGLTGKQP